MSDSFWVYVGFAPFRSRGSRLLASTGVEAVVVHRRVMNNDGVQVERRGAQRFGFHVAVSLHVITGRDGHGFTQDLSGRGALVCTDFEVATGENVELTFVMPPEITLTDAMPVRCRGKVMRVNAGERGAKASVAVQIESYEFLPESKASPGERIAALHSRRDGEEKAEKYSPSHPVPAS